MITITVDNAAALAGLAEINPAQIQSKMRGAVRRTLKAGKLEARGRITARYNAKNPFSLGKDRSYVGGMNGYLTFIGKRNEVKHFIYRPSTRPPHNPPGGIFVQIVKGHGGYLKRGFIGDGRLWERHGHDRTQIHRVRTISLPGMAKAVKDYVLNKMNTTIERELATL